MHVYPAAKFILVNNLPTFLHHPVIDDIVYGHLYMIPRTHSAFMCMESKFHNGLLQFREPSLLQASNGILVSGFAGTRVK